MASNDDKSGKGILLESGTNEVEFLRFKVSTESYGINVAKVRQIIQLKTLVVTQLPQSPASVKGMVYFRGKPIPIVDLGVYLKVNRTNLNPDSQLLLVCEFNNTQAGFLVDEIDRIVRCSWSEFVPVDSGIFKNTEASILGTITVDDTVVMILDAETLLGTIVPSASIDYYMSEIPKSVSIDRSAVNIVYCEDSKVVQKVLLKSLNEAGFKNVKTFLTGAEGLNYLRSAEAKATDIILSDIEMPQMDGLTMCKEVRNLDNFKKVPFIFFSSMINDEMKNKCKSVGGDAAYSKPEVHHIVEAIDSLLAAK